MIYFPRIQEMKETKKELVANEIQKGSETALLVEDEEAILSVGEAILNQFGYKVLSASTPGKALTLAEQYEGPIHLLLTDVVMPEMNGKELAARIEKNRPHIKVLLCQHTQAILSRRRVFLKVRFGSLKNHSQSPL